MKLYIIRKFIYARSIGDALRQEKKHKPDEIYLDDEWKRNNPKELEKKKVFGFNKK